MSNLNSEYQKLQDIQTQKILYFCDKIGHNDMSYAEKYLSQANWDERLAYNIFLQKHPNFIPSNHHHHHNEDLNNQNFQPQFAPPTQISHNRHNNQNKKENENEKNNYLIFNIGEALIKSEDNNGYNSDYINYLKMNLKGIEYNYERFLKILKIKSGIILFFNDESFNKIKEQIKKINEIYAHDCVIFPVLKNSPIGNELIQQLTILSSPCYFFCKYKDDKNFYLTGRMEGAFDINFFKESINKIKPKINNNLNSNNIKNNVNNNNANKSNNVNNINNNNKKDDKKNNENSIINIRKDLIKENINRQKKNVSNINKNNKSQINKKINNNNNRYNNNNINEDNKNIPPKNQNISEINKKNNNNGNNINYNDFYLGDSRDIPNLFLNNNNNNNYNYNYNNNPNMNNNYIDQNINLNPNPNPNIVNNNNSNNFNYNNNKYNNNINNNNNNENINNDPNILADSIYQLSDGKILAQREQKIKELERQQEEKERKEKEEKMKELEEEKRIKKLNQQYDKEAESAKKKLSQEPEEDNPNVCHILFKSPNGEKIIERRFLKTDKIRNLYDYVKSVGREIFTEPDSHDFDILSSDFPPKNLEGKKNNTLEEEGLFPNSILQIREK